MTFAFPDTEALGARWCSHTPAPSFRPQNGAGPITLEALRERVRRYNSDIDPDSPRFRAAVLLLAGSVWGHNVDRLARRTGYDRAFVARCARRLIDNGVWQNGRTIGDWSLSDEASGSFWNDVGVAEGVLCRRVGADGLIEWAPPGYWNKHYEFVDSGEQGLSVHYRDALPTPSQEAAARPAAEVEPVPPASQEPEPIVASDDAAASESGREETSSPPTLEEVFTGAVWLR